MKKGGLLCGDDLEIVPTEDDSALEHARANPKIDCCQFNGRGYHPGVYAGIYDNHGSLKINGDNGFWWIDV